MITFCQFHFFIIEYDKISSDPQVVKEIQFGMRMVVQAKKIVYPRQPNLFFADFYLNNEPYPSEIKTEIASILQIHKKDLKLNIIANKSDMDNVKVNHTYDQSFNLDSKIFGLHADSLDVRTVLNSTKFSPDLRKMLWRNLELKKRSLEVSMPSPPVVRTISGMTN